MKIEETTNQQVAPINLYRNEKVEEQAAVRENKPAETAPKSTVRSDSVNLSPAVDRFNKATEFLKDIPETRPDRVQEIKSRIDSGEYNVKSKDVAAKMLSSMKNGYGG